MFSVVLLAVALIESGEVAVRALLDPLTNMVDAFNNHLVTGRLVGIVVVAEHDIFVVEGRVLQHHQKMSHLGGLLFSDINMYIGVSHQIMLDQLAHGFGPDRLVLERDRQMHWYDDSLGDQGLEALDEVGDAFRVGQVGRNGDTNTVSNFNHKCVGHVFGSSIGRLV